MRKISATYIFPCNHPPVKNGILICEDDGSIVGIKENKENFRELERLEFYSGILVPGFVNACCRLEILHTEGMSPWKPGTGNYVKEVNTPQDENTGGQEAISCKAGRKMWANGIAAVGGTPDTVGLVATENPWFVLCPLTNLGTGKQMPPVESSQTKNVGFCLGTGDPVYNPQLSILAEIIAVQQYFPEVKLEEIIQWACINGAKALKQDSLLGSFEKGKKPGVNLISGIDFKKMRVSDKSRVKRLV